MSAAATSHDPESAKRSSSTATRSYPTPPSTHLTPVGKHQYKWFSPHHLHFADAAGNDVEWQARRQRKRRYATAQYSFEHEGKSYTPYLRLPSVELKPNLRGDVSFWIAALFTFGSIVWVINGFLAWIPFLYPSVGTDAVEKAAAGLGFIGGLVFEAGAYLMVVEALDRYKAKLKSGREHEFGTALGGLIAPGARERVEYDWKHYVRRTSKRRSRAQIEGTGTSDRHEYPHGSSGFVWWGRPMWDNMGYFAAFVMFVAASIFWIPTLIGLPGVIPGLAEGRHRVISIIFFWLPQVVGGVGFVLASTVLVLEVQHKWWRPRPLDIGWQVGFWNLIGSIGFVLCPAFGFSHAHNMRYQSSLATFWGSCAFLVGSAFQLAEISLREPPPKSDLEKKGKGGGGGEEDPRIPRTGAKKVETNVER